MLCNIVCAYVFLVALPFRLPYWHFICIHVPMRDICLCSSGYRHFSDYLIILCEARIKKHLEYLGLWGISCFRLHNISKCLNSM
jgi:hypothetical protein